MRPSIRHRRILAAATALLLALLPLSGQSKKEAWQPAAGLEDWDAAIDLSPFAPGTYNLLIRAKDKAGNYRVAPALNVIVDPASDLPRASIINPTPLLRVGEDLNIVGTCTDDDGVASVEVAIDSGEFRKAEGGAFWSLLVPTKDIPDGRRLVSARGVDINGLTGPVAKVYFNLDHQPPVVTVEKPAAGSLAAGQIQIDGTVSDANGVRSLEISIDEGKTWQKVIAGGKSLSEKLTFHVPIDTRKLEDGPRIFRMRSIDGVGSLSTSSYLLYVDNTKPTLALARPAADAAVNGIFTVAGSVRDIVGVKSLAWAFDGKQGEIALTKGDPYFAMDFDAGPVKADKAEVVLVATDEIGNQTRLVVAPKIDRNADKPVLSVSFPAPGAKVKAGAYVWGGIRDDDGVSAFRWSLDGAAPQVVECGEVFSLALPDSASGKHLLVLTPVDSNGLAGDPVSLPYVLDKGGPSISFSGLAAEKATARPWRTGIEVKVDGGEFLEGRVLAPNPPASSEYAIGATAARKLDLLADGPGAWKFRIPLDRSLPYGFVDLLVRIKDAMDNLAELSALLSVVDYGGIREDTGFRFVDERLGSEGRIAFGPPAADGSRRPFLGTFYREKLASLSLDPPTSLVEVSLDGESVVVTPKGEGTTAPTTIRGRSDRGHEFAAGPFVFATDATPPALSLAEPAEGSWTRAAPRFAGKASDAGGLAELGWRLLPSGETKKLPLPAGAGEAFSFTLPLSDLPGEGAFSVLVEARDGAGNVSQILRDFGVDSSPPKVTFISPPAGSLVSGPEDLVARVDDASAIASVEFAEDGATFAPLAWSPPWFAQRVDLAAKPKAAFRVTDVAGNVWTGRPDVKAGVAPLLIPLSDNLAVEAAAGEARVELAAQAGTRLVSLKFPALSEADFLALPSDGSLPERFGTRIAVNSSLSLKGQALVDGQLKAVSASLDGGSTWLPLASVADAKNAKPALAFSLPVDPAKLAQGPARWALKVEDFAGATWFAPLYVVVDSKGPELSVLSPEAGAAVAGKRPLVVKASDELGLASLEASGGLVASLDAKSGGAWYTITLDPGEAKAWQVAFTLTARDRAGNATVLPLKFSLDPAASLPRLALTSATDPVAVLAAGDLVSGTFSDDEGLPKLKAVIDALEPQVFEGGSFAFALPGSTPGPGLAPGKHRLLLILTDRGGRTVEQKRDFTVKGSAPAFGAFEAGDKAGKTAFRQGMALDTRNGMALLGSLSAPNGLASLEASVNGGVAQRVDAGKPGPDGTLAFSLSLPAALPPDRILVAILAKDAAGLSAERRLEFHAVLPSALANDTADGLRFPAFGIFSAESPPRALLAADAVVEGLFRGRPLARVSIVPASPLLEASFEGSYVRVTAKGQGLPPEATVKVETVDGDTFTWGPALFVLDQETPGLELTPPADGSWLVDKLHVSGLASDENGIVALSARLNEGAPLDLPLAGAAAGAAKTAPAATASKQQPFDLVLPLATVGDGPVRLEVIARDRAGRERVLSRFFNKDGVAPKLVQILPAPGETVNGRTTLVIEASDAGRLATALFKPLAADPGQEVLGLRTIAHDIDFARLVLPLGPGLGFIVTDKAGNSSALAPDLVIDPEKDKPVVQVLSPSDKEVIRRDFAVSGFVFDDDGVGTLSYRIDGGEWKSATVSGSSYSLPFSLADFADNGHLVELFAEDIYGVRGDLAPRTFRVSKEEPVARMNLPAIDRPVRGLVYIMGSASDANGIKEVSVSVDNRTTFRTPEGTLSWSLPFDTRLVADGIHPVAVRPVDSYDIEGFYASMVGVDNTAPTVTLDLPSDGSRVAGELLVSGRVADNLGLESVRIEIAPVGSKDPPLLSIDPGLVSVVRRTIDISALPRGDYAVRIVATDRARNSASASREVAVTGPAPDDSVTIFFPADGSRLGGRYQIQGRADVVGLEDEISVLVDGQSVGTTKAGPRGWFAFELPAASVADGKHEVGATARGTGGKAVKSLDISFEWKADMPWITIDSFLAGDFIHVRPWLSGKTGWDLAGATAAADATSAAGASAAPSAKDQKALAEARRPVLVEVSLDNGLHYAKAEGTLAWKYRLENLDWKDGSVFIIVRATFGDGAMASRRLWLFLDKTLPEVEVIAPVEGGRYNASLAVAGTARDANGLESVEVALRKGDKKSYQLPTFIQGLYIDGQGLGATAWQGGVGLTFLDDNVKLQALYGQAPEFGGDGSSQSFYGDVFGAKLIANIAFLPFSAILGPDWSFLSASLGLGANFTYFSKTQADVGLIVGSVFGQIEFPKVTIDSLAAFKKFSLYTEFQVWVLSSVVSGGFIPRISFGGRVGVF